MRSNKLADHGRAGLWRRRTSGEPGRLRAGFTLPALLVGGIATLVLSCGDDGVGPTPPPPPPPAPVATTVTVDPGSASFTALGETARFTAEVRDQNGQVMAGAAVAWASSDASVATVDVSGVATAVANGTTTITATAGTASGTVDVTVTQDVSAVSVSPAADTLVAGDTLRLSAEATDANGHAVPAAELVWASSDTTVATVDPSGLATAIGAGEVEITATSSGVVGRAAMVVEKPRPRVSISTLATAAPEGGTAVIEVAVDTPPDSALTVHYLVRPDDDMETDDADPRDYSEPGGGFVEIVGGASGTRIEISIVDDPIAEPAREVFQVALAMPVAGTRYVLGAPATAVVTIEEGVCDRTPVIRDEILRQMEADDCVAPDKSNLADIGSIDICFLKYAYMSRPCEDREEYLITGLLEGDFLDLIGLRTLHLRGHELGSLPARVFSGLFDLRSLNLARSGLTELRPDLFSGLANLSTLNLFHNQLTTLPQEVFSDLPRLQSLSLRSNGLADLPAGVFDGLSNLTHLDLRYNNLTESSLRALRDLPQLKWLDVAHNRLTKLPAGLFSMLPNLSGFNVDANPGSPFALKLRLVRTDSDNPTAPGPARVKVTLAEGAPVAMDIGLSARAAVLSAHTVALPAGAVESEEITVTPNAGSPASVSIGSLPTVCDRCSGALVVAGSPLVLANPDAAQVSIQGAYLTQGTQNLRTDVPLIAGREALLRVFATATESNAFNLEGRATFFRNGREIHRTSLGTLSGIPTDVDESRLELSLNARIPADVLQPGLGLVVELDPDSKLPLLAGSLTRFPAEGLFRPEVRLLPRLDLTIVPVSYHTDANQGTNAAINGFARDLAAAGSEIIGRVRGVMPVGDMRVRVRDPYVTWADTTDGGKYELLREIDVIRHLETGGTGEYYHGIYAYPRQRVSGRWVGGIAQLGGYSALSGWTLSAHPGRVPIARLFVHEFGHNLSLRHAPCRTPDPDPDFPYADGNIGVWGHTFLEPGATELGRLFHAVETTDVMTYCGDVSWWLSDYGFRKALEHRLATASAASVTRNVNPAKVLILWGGIRDGNPILEAPFAYDGRVKLPDTPGAYNLDGVDANGRRLFSLSFEPDTLAHGGGRSFLFAIPLDQDWIDALDRVTLSGAEGSTALSLDDAVGPVVWVDRSTGTVRGIAREWPERVPASLAADVEAMRTEVVRGLIRR